MLKHNLFKAIDLSVLAILLTAAFFLSFKAGERGFFALDQAMYFDGAYRIVCGQIPFKYEKNVYNERSRG